jgi:hypothetical protein
MRALLPVLLLVAPLSVFAQQEQGPICLTDERHAHVLATDSAYGIRTQVVERMMRMARHPGAERGGELTIPVVVHIIHENGEENISDAVAINGVAQLNEAFANAGPYQVGTGTNTPIRFCLATRSPEGLATTGIEHIASPLTNVLVEAQDDQLKALSHWDPFHYLNIYVVRTITSAFVGEGVAGYAYLPALHGSPTDGVAVEYLFFGGDDGMAKVTVHEVGHYLGLLHTFDGGCANNDCLTQGDLVCDTAPDGSSASGPCDGAPNTCSTDEDDTSTNNPYRPVVLGGLGDQPDPYHNYLDYGDLACKDHFTAGQSDRMFAALTTARSSLLESQGCVSPCDIPFNASFSASPAGTLAPGQNVVFTNTSLGATVFQWTVDGQSQGTSSSITIAFADEGAHVVQLQASNASGNCLAVAIDTVVVDCPGNATFSISATEVFPGDSIHLSNTSAGLTGPTWYLDGTAVGHTNDTTLVINEGGIYTVYLTTDGPACANSSTTVFIQVGNCVDHSSDLHWYFGDSAAIRFHTGAPEPLADNPMYAREGTSAWTDMNGDLVFYSNGITVYDRLHQPMPNGTGLLGGPTTSSINQTLIVPMPGDPDRFYVIAMDELENDFENGVTWSVVNMTLNNGLGDVELANQPLLFTGGETLGACYHSDGEDVWLVFPVIEPARGLHVYRVTATGIIPWNVVPLPEAVYVTRSYFSNSGKRLVCSIRQAPATWVIRLYDFDPTTGILSDPLTWPSIQNSGAMTMEFSPSDRFLYFSRIIGLDQYDLSQTTAVGIQNSGVTVYSNTFPTALRLAPDGRIYGDWAPFNKLPRIASPDVPGLGCTYQQQGADIAPGQGVAGLPTFIKGKRYRTTVNLLAPDTVCIGSSATVEALAYDSTCTYTWYVSGTAVTPDVVGTLVVPYAGQDSVQVVVTKACACGGISGHTTVHFVEGPAFSLGADTSMCLGDALVLDAGNGYGNYTWSTGSTQQTTTVTTPGDVWAEVEFNGCVARDSILVNVVPPAPPVDLGPDRSACTGAVVVLDAGPGYTAYSWQDGWSQPTYTAWNTGTYWVTATSPCGTSADTVLVELVDAAPMDLGPDVVACIGTPHTLNAAPATGVYWSTGDTTTTITVTTTGTYWAEVPQPDGCTARDSVHVRFVTCAGEVPCTDTAMHWYHQPEQGGSWLTIPCPFITGIGTIHDVRGRLVSDALTLHPGPQWIAHSDWAASTYILRAVIDGEVRELKFVLGR